MRISNSLKLIIALALPQLAGAIGAFYTAPAISTWYDTLTKPALNPPAWVFAPVWTTLFVLMGIAAFLVWRKGLEYRDVRIALGLFVMQLVLNTLWSFLFFGLRDPGAALVEIVVLWVAILATIIAFARTSPSSADVWSEEGRGKLAAWLLVPYILWVSFAVYLNYALWILN